MESNKKYKVIVRGIKEYFYTVNEDLCKEDRSQLVKIDLYNTIGVNIDHKYVKFMVAVYIHYNNPLEKLAQMEVNNFFFIPNMEEFEVIDNNVVFPNEVLLIMVRESIAHLRALFAQKLSSTNYKNVIIPYDDAEAITKHFFPHLYSPRREKVNS